METKNLAQLDESTEVREVSEEVAEEESVPKSQAINGLNVQMIPVSELMFDSEQPRKFSDKCEVDSIAASIKAYGIINPLTVRRVDNGFFVVTGEQRLRAAMQLNLDSVPCIECNGSNFSEVSLVENLLRSDLTVIEKAEAFQKLASNGSTVKELSARFGLKQNTISEIIGVTRLSSEIKEMCRNDRTVALRELKRIAVETDEAIQLEMFKKYKNRKESVLRLKPTRKATPSENTLKAVRMLRKLLEAPEYIQDNDIRKKVSEELLLLVGKLTLAINMLKNEDNSQANDGSE